MIYNEFCGEKISRLGFGCMRFPESFEDVQILIDKAIELGINYFDTAYVYGDSEIKLGKALKKHERSSFYVTSKMPSWQVKKEDDIDRIFNDTLKRMGVDYIDYYLIHSVSDANEIKEKNIYPYLLNKKKEGIIKHLGFSIHANMDCLKAMLELGDFDFVQIQLNYLDIIHEPGYEGYELLKQRGIPVVIMEPLKGGTLANIPESFATPFREIDKEASNASFAFRWLLELDNVKVILSGMNAMDQLLDNVKTFSNVNKLSDKELEAINLVKENIVKAQKVPCTGCRYCMPCPMGVDIPGSFKVWNTLALKKASNNHGWINDTSIERDVSPTKCVECKKCMQHCPQHIQIPYKLKELVKELKL